MSFQSESTISQENPTDVLILGAGPAGLAVASSLSRLLHTCILFSLPTYRNTLATHMHGILTWEHCNPSEFRAAARSDLLSHYDTLEFQDTGIVSVKKISADGEDDEGKTLFKAVDEKGKEWWGRKLVIATGVRDVMLDIEGYEECWVKGIFHCLFCHGYEERGAASAGVLAIDDISPPHVALHIARYANRLASKITIYTNGNTAVTTAISSVLLSLPPNSKTPQNISINASKITKFVKHPEGSKVEVFLEGGERKIEGFLAHKPKGEVNMKFVEELGLELTPQGIIKTNEPFKETSVRGVFAAGDCSTLMQAAPMAIAAGGAVGAGVAAQLETED